MKPSKRIQKLIAEFDEAAQWHGWEMDQGTGTGPDRSKEAYERTKKQLEAAVARLENKVHKLKKNMNVSYGPFPGSKEVL